MKAFLFLLKFLFAGLFGSILSRNRVKYKNSHSRANYCDCYCLMNTAP